MTKATLDDLNVTMAEAEGLGVAFSEELKGAVRDAGNPHYTMGAELGAMEEALGDRVEAVVRHFRRATKAYIDQCEEAERAKVKRAFDEALDEKPDDPEAIRCEIEALGALAGRI